jgi:hypothetical protein
MSRRLTVFSLSATCLALAASPALASTVVGQTGQGNVQGVNSDQSAVNGTGTSGGANSVIGNATPVLDQNSANVGVDAEAMASGGSTLIANGPGDGFTQLNQTGTNSEQTGVNGDGGQGIFGTQPMLDQNSENLTVSAELMATDGATILIGDNAQSSSIAVNSAQSGNDFPGGGESSLNLDQNSANFVINAILLGG